MAYKSRVTNKYMGSSFGGQVASSRTSSASDLINILQKDVNPALGKMAEQYGQVKKDTAKEKLNQLLLTKDSKTVQQEILAGKHPELSNQYSQKVVSLHTGKHSAAETIAKIELAKKEKYDFKETNLAAFYKDYLPNFADKDGSYALGFASIFNEYKATEAIKDAKIRSQQAKDDKINQGVSILNSKGAGQIIDAANNLNQQVPSTDGSAIPQNLFSNEEINETIMQWASNKYSTATKTDEIDAVLYTLKSPRKTDDKGNVLVDSLASTQRTDVAALIGKLQIRRVTLENQSRVEKEMLTKKQKDQTWEKANSKNEDGSELNLKQKEEILEEFKKIDPDDYRGLAALRKKFNEDPKDRLLADPAAQSNFKLRISRNEFNSHSEMQTAFEEENIGGEITDYTATFNNAVAQRGKKPIYDVDPSYVSAKKSVANQLKQLFPKDVATGSPKHLIPTENAMNWIDEQILLSEEEAQSKKQSFGHTERRKLSKELMKEALDLFKPYSTQKGDTPSKKPDPSSVTLQDLRQQAKEEEMRLELTVEEERSRQAALDVIVPNLSGAPNEGGGNMTLGNYIKTLSQNIRKSEKNEFAVRRLTTISEEALLEQVNKPRVAKFLKNIFGDNFNSDVYAAIPEKEYNNLVTEIANNFGLLKRVPKNSKDKTKTNKLIEENREAMTLINSVIQQFVEGQQ
tara:strand:- start:2385 stop:4445 length:2061 start_codon:yes stop_codon:yes gene_type:complete